MSLCRLKRAASRGIIHTFGRTATRRFTGVSNGTPRPLTGRADLCHARRVVVKLGSNVIAGPSNTLAVGCIGSIVEQVSGECESPQRVCSINLCCVMDVRRAGCTVICRLTGTRHVGHASSL